MPEPDLNERFDAANEIFAAALSRPPQERIAFVRNSCGDPALAETVERLLLQFEKVGSFLEHPAREAPPDLVLSSGEVLIGRFKIIRCLGSGGMGTVYRADDLRLGDTVALKVVRSHLRKEQEVMFRFRTEIRLARRIAHPNVCRIFDLFTELRNNGEELVFFTMEFLEGPTLASYLVKHQRLPVSEILAISGAIAAGLDAAHLNGVVHRDLKPGNIMFTRNSLGEKRIVITDFGLAKSLEPIADNVSTQPGLMIGSPGYMSPEQFQGLAVTKVADIYSFAMIIFEMAVGRRPFPDENLLSTAVRRLTENAPSIYQLAPDVPRHWDYVFGRALSRNPTNRPRSATELVLELSRDGSWQPMRYRLARLKRRNFVAIGAAGATMAGSFWILRHIDQRLLLEPGEKSPLLMLTPLTQSSGTSAPGNKAASLSFLLEKQLGQSSRVRVLSKERVGSAWKLINGGVDKPLASPLPPRTAREIALRQGVQLILFGSLSQVADEWVLQLRLERLGNSPEHARAWRSQDFRQQDRPSVAYEAVNWIRRSLGESAMQLEARDRRPEELTTNNWHALDEYVQGDDAWHAGNLPGALEHLKEALHEDGEFALAAARLADILTAAGRPDEGLGYYEQAEKLLIARHLTDRESLLIRGRFALDTGRFDEADHVFALYAQDYPDDALPLFYRSAVLDHMGRRQEATRLLDLSIHIEPNSYFFLLRRALRSLEERRLDDAESDCVRTSQQSTTDWVDQLRSAIAFDRLDFEKSLNYQQRMLSLGSNPFKSKSYLLQACFRYEQGQADKAEQLLRNGIKFDQSTELSLEPKDLKQLALMRLLFETGRRREALQQLGELQTATLGTEDSLRLACLLAQMGEARLATSYFPKDEPKWPYLQHWFIRLRAEIALAQGYAQRAFEVIRRAPSRRVQEAWPAYLVRIAFAAGETEVVNEWLNALFSHPGRFWYFADQTEFGFLSFALSTARHAKFQSLNQQTLTNFHKLSAYFKGNSI